MSERSPVGRTAMGAALQRIAHLLFDGEPKIFVDLLAQSLLGLSDDEVARANRLTDDVPERKVLYEDP